MRDGRLKKFIAVAQTREDEDVLTQIAIMAYSKVKIVKLTDPPPRKKAKNATS